MMGYMPLDRRILNSIYACYHTGHCFLSMSYSTTNILQMDSRNCRMQFPCKFSKYERVLAKSQLIWHRIQSVLNVDMRFVTSLLHLYFDDQSLPQVAKIPWSISGDSTFCGIISFGLAILKEAAKQISLFLRIAITLKSHEGEDNPLFAASGQLKNMYDERPLITGAYCQILVSASDDNSIRVWGPAAQFRQPAPAHSRQGSLHSNGAV